MKALILGALALVMVAASCSAQQILVDEKFADNAAGWQLTALGYGKPVAEISGGRLLLKPDSGGGESSDASAVLTIEVPHTNLDVSFTANFADGTFWSHEVSFELLSAEDQTLGSVGIFSQHSIIPGVQVQQATRRFAPLVSADSALQRGEPLTLSFNIHALKQQGRLAGVNEKLVRKLRISFVERWMGRTEVSALRVVAGAPVEPLGITVGQNERYGGTPIAFSTGELRILGDKPAWVTLTNGAARDDYIKSNSEPVIPFRIEVDGRAYSGTDFSWVGYGKDKTGVWSWEGTSEELGLRVMIGISHDPQLPTAIELFADVFNQGNKPRRVVVYPLYLDGLQLGDTATDQRVVMPTYIGFNGSIESYAKVCNGDRVYPQNMSMQYMALYNPTADDSLAIWVQDPDVHYKTLNIAVNPWLEATASVGFEPITLEPGKYWTTPPVVVDIGDGNWYDSARRYANWWRSQLRSRKSPDWVHRAGQVFHQNIGYGDPEKPLAELLPSIYGDFKQASLNYATPMTFDLGELPAIKREGAAGEAAGIAQIHKQYDARAFIYMPAISEYDTLPVSKQMTDWYVLREDGSMLPTWLDNATFCPGYAPVIQYRTKQAITRITTRGADGVYVDESLAQGYHPCYNKLHNHPTPYDWGRSQRLLWKSLREGVDAQRPGVGLITEGCCDVVVDYADGFMWGPSGQDDGVPPMRVAFPERAYFSHIGYGPPGISARASTALLFVNGLSIWYINTPPPKDLSEWTATLADWHERLADFLVSGRVLRDPILAPGAASPGVVARAYGSGERMLIAVANLGTGAWNGALARPANADWPGMPKTATELLSGKKLAVSSGRIELELGPEQVAIIQLG